MNNFERYFKAINFLEGLSNLPLSGDYMIKQRNLGIYLKRMRYFLKLIGNPDKDMKFIHVTGTSGKGSVTNKLHEVLRVSGKKVGSFTSPFVTTSIEKIKVQDKFISPNELADIVEYLKPFIDKAYLNGPYGRPSYFEIFFAIALIYFKQKKCEYVVLEVGLGGRFDATNVIKRPIVTAITNIDFDHVEILGKTLKQIAFDKAGIIKRGCVFYTSEQKINLLKIFKEICEDKKVTMVEIPHQNNYRDYNNALVTEIIKGLDLDISDKDIKKGIKLAKLQCRFEVMQNDPMFILDGAHNRSKIASTVENLSRIHYKKLLLVIGMAENKNYNDILKQIIPLADEVSFTRFQIKDRKCAHPKILLALAKKYLKEGANTQVFLDPEIAMEDALKKAKKGCLILVAGSFFLAGEIRKLWYPEKEILQLRKSFIK